MDDALFMRRFQRFGDLPGNRQCLVKGNRPLRDPICQRRPLDEFHHQRDCAGAPFQAVDVGYVRMIQRREDFCFALETRHTFSVGGNYVG